MYATSCGILREDGNNISQSYSINHIFMANNKRDSWSSYSVLTNLACMLGRVFRSTFNSPEEINRICAIKNYHMFYNYFNVN